VAGVLSLLKEKGVILTTLPDFMFEHAGQGTPACTLAAPWASVRAHQPRHL